MSRLKNLTAATIHSRSPTDWMNPVMRTLAYIDAGTGSMLVQALLGGTAGLIVFFKAKGRTLLRRNKSSDRLETPEPTGS